MKLTPEQITNLLIIIPCVIFTLWLNLLYRKPDEKGWNALKRLLRRVRDEMSHGYDPSNVNMQHKCRKCKTRTASSWYGEKWWLRWVWWCETCYLERFSKSKN